LDQAGVPKSNLDKLYIVMKALPLDGFWRIYRKGWRENVNLTSDMWREELLTIENQDEFQFYKDRLIGQDQNNNKQHKEQALKINTKERKYSCNISRPDLAEN
jgi:ureidoglycolate hydrolase